MDVSDRVDKIKYAIRDVQVLANELINQGHEILQFNIGDPLKFDYEVPDVMQKSLKENLHKGYY
ncbi:alanine aminotransferase, partial [archaeon]|nr:alanine aminotransferase [archaeon]